MVYLLTVHIVSEAESHPSIVIERGHSSWMSRYSPRHGYVTTASTHHAGTGRSPVMIQSLQPDPHSAAIDGYPRIHRLAPLVGTYRFCTFPRGCRPQSDSTGRIITVPTEGAGAGDEDCYEGRWMIMTHGMSGEGEDAVNWPLMCRFPTGISGERSAVGSGQRRSNGWRKQAGNPGVNSAGWAVVGVVILGMCVL